MQGNSWTTVGRLLRVAASFNNLLECVALVKSDNATCGHHDLLTSHRISARTFNFVTRLETTETGEFDAFTTNQTGTYLGEKSIDHLFGFTLVQANTAHDSLSKFGFCECHGDLQ